MATSMFATPALRVLPTTALRIPVRGFAAKKADKPKDVAAAARAKLAKDDFTAPGLKENRTRHRGPDGMLAELMFAFALRKNIDPKVTLKNLKHWISINNGVLDFVVSRAAFSLEENLKTLAETENPDTGKKFGNLGYDGATLWLIEKLVRDKVSQDVNKLVLPIFEDVVREHYGEVEVIVTTADPLTAAQKKAITAKVKSQLKGKTVSISEKLDTDLLGGLTLKILPENHFVDISVAKSVKSVCGSVEM